MPKINWQEIVDGDFTVEDVITDIDIDLGSIMNGTAWRDPFTEKRDMINYINHNLRNYTNSSFPEIENYFVWKYKI